METSTPFNIKVASLRLGDFTEAEVAELYGQHTAETGQESPAARTTFSLRRRTWSPNDPFARGLRERYNQLETERTATLAEMRDLNAADDAKPDLPTIDDVDLLNALPYLALNLAQAQQDFMRRLFEIIQRSVRLHQESDDVTIKITLPADMLPQVAEAAERFKKTPCPHNTGCPPAGQPDV